MPKIIRVAIREYKAAVKTKGFIIGLVVAPILMSGSLIAMLLLKDQVDTTDKIVAIVDRSGVVAEAVVKAAEERNSTEVYDTDSGEKIKPAYVIEVIEPRMDSPDAQRLELADRIRNKDLYAFVEIGPDVLYPGKDSESSRIKYYSENAALDDLRRWIRNPINNHLRRYRLTDAGVDESTMEDLFRWINAEALDLPEIDSETGHVKEEKRSDEAKAIGAPLIMVMLMFMMVLMGALPLLNSVMEEKNQRIAEVMLGSVKPFEFMLGKVIGGFWVALTSSSVYLIGGIYFVGTMGLSDYVPFHAIPWFLLFMSLHIFMMGSIFTAIGSLCSDAKDAQNLTFPAMIPMMIPIFIMVPVLKEPLSGFATYMSLFPLFTPMLMILRLASPISIPMWQPFVGFMGVLLFTVLAAWAGGRIFRIGILLQGKPPRLTDLVKWAIRG